MRELERRRDDAACLGAKLGDGWRRQQACERVVEKEVALGDGHAAEVVGGGDDQLPPSLDARLPVPLERVDAGLLGLLRKHVACPARAGECRRHLRGADELVGERLSVVDAVAVRRQDRGARGSGVHAGV